MNSAAKLTKAQKTLLETVRAGGEQGVEMIKAKQGVTADRLVALGLIERRCVRADGMGPWAWFAL